MPTVLGSNVVEKTSSFLFHPHEYLALLPYPFASASIIESLWVTVSATDTVTDDLKLLPVCPDVG